MIKCPQCNGLSTIPIIYGKPSVALERASSRGLVELAGCIVDANNPTMRCLDCHHSWRNSVATSASDEKLDRVRSIVDRYLFPIHAGMVSSELFNDRQWQTEAASFEAIYAYIQLKDVLGINRGCTLEQVVHVHSFKKANSDYYNRIINELKRQVCLLTLSGRDALHENLFLACALTFNASPICHGNLDEESLDHFLDTIRSGRLGFE